MKLSSALNANMFLMFAFQAGHQFVFTSGVIFRAIITDNIIGFNSTYFFMLNFNMKDQVVISVYSISTAGAIQFPYAQYLTV